MPLNFIRNTFNKYFPGYYKTYVFNFYQKGSEFHLLVTLLFFAFLSISFPILP